GIITFDQTFTVQPTGLTITNSPGTDAIDSVTASGNVFTITTIPLDPTHQGGYYGSVTFQFTDTNGTYHVKSELSTTDSDTEIDPGTTIEFDVCPECTEDGTCGDPHVQPIYGTLYNLPTKE